MAFLEPKKIALLIAVLAGFLTTFDRSAVNIALPIIGSGFSMGIAMVIISLFIDPVMIMPDIAAQLLTSIHVGFFIFAVLCCCGIFFSLVRETVREG